MQSVRKAHDIESKDEFFYRPKYSVPQYSQAYADWIVERYRNDPEFFAKARKAYQASKSR